MIAPKPAPSFDPGKPPELTWLWCEQLAADPRYQRSIESRRSEANIRRICAGFTWALFGAATVAKGEAVPEGGGVGFAIIDGQHRIEAARRLGIRQVPCLIVDAVDLAEQARLFVAANRDRVSLSPLGIHAALVAAGDERAVALHAACAEAGVEILRFPMQVRNMKPGQTMAVGTVRTVLAQQGAAALTDTLRVVRKHWPGPGEIRAERIRGLAAAVRAHGVEAVDRAVAAIGPAALDEAAEAGPETGDTRAGAMRAAVLRRIEVGGPAAPAPVARLAPPAAERRRPVPNAGVSVQVEPEEERGLLMTAVQRRCPRCRGVFRTRRVRQTVCDGCTGAGAA